MDMTAVVAKLLDVVTETGVLRHALPFHLWMTGFYD